MNKLRYVSSKSLEIEEVPLAYQRCQSLTEEDHQDHTERSCVKSPEINAQSAEQRHKIFPSGNSDPIEGNRRILIAFRQRGQQIKCLFSSQRRNIGGVQPTVLCDKHIIKQIFAQNSFCSQWENHRARWGFYMPQKSTSWRMAAILLSWLSILNFAVSSLKLL